MDVQIPSSQATKPSTSWLSLLQLVFSALAASFLLGAAALIALNDFTQGFIQGSIGADRTQTYMIAASLAFAGLIVLPSAWYSWKRIAYPEAEATPRPEPRHFGLVLTVVLLMLVAGALLLGARVSRDEQVSWYLLPPLNILATGLPALWLAYVGTRGLIPGAPSRRWGVFASGLVLGPVVILLIELIMLLGLGILVILWVMLDPDLSSQLNSLLFRLQHTGADSQSLLDTLLPFLLNPGILLMVFAFVSLIVPMVEEALKPVGVWFLARQKLTPAQGFGYGVLSGLGFGLFENLGNTTTGGEAWVLLASSRISTLLLHGLTAGLVGWALASAWRNRKYFYLVITYILAVLLHGLWNGMAVLSIFSGLQGETSLSIPTFLVQVGDISAIVIVALGAFNLVFFIGFSNMLRRNLNRKAGPIGGPLLEPEVHNEPAVTDNDAPALSPAEAKPDSQLDEDAIS
jgi:RsiW-degrading membrane proteinase PrsW (M82 family)